MKQLFFRHLDTKSAKYCREYHAKSYISRILVQENVTNKLAPTRLLVVEMYLVAPKNRYEEYDFMLC